MKVRAKFHCSHITAEEYRGGLIVRKACLTPVYDNSPENKEFFESTPSGSIELVLLSQSTLDAFVPGKEYYVDFTPAEYDYGKDVEERRKAEGL